jgi:probable HAF family extracellular repeat protein
MKRQPAMKRGAIVALLLGLAASTFGAAGATATAYQALDLNPVGFSETWACGAGGGQQVGYSCWGMPSRSSVRAMLWTGSAGSALSLHPGYMLPDQFMWSGAVDTDGVQQVGWGNVYYTDYDRITHASYTVDYYRPLLWSGSAASAVNLQPVGFGDVWVLGVGGGQQVGYGTTGYYTNYGKSKGSTPTFVGQTHALLWTGTATSVVDLNPPGFTYSAAYGVTGGQQVGQGNYYTTVSYYTNYSQNPRKAVLVSYTVAHAHALLWSGSAANAVDLHPVGFTSSLAYGVGGGQQVGYGVCSDGTQHALVWAGGAAGAVDLHPAVFTSSAAKRVHGGYQVGYGDYADGTRHALVWNGTAASVVDLHTLLPPGYLNSVATGIDAAGNVVGYAYDYEAGEVHHAFLWKPQ